MQAWSLTVPLGIAPGQRATAGTRMPPSKVLPLALDRGVLRAQPVPPLSLLKMTTVFSASPFSSSLVSMRPIHLSICSIMAMYTSGGALPCLHSGESPGNGSGL